jgi:tRNA_anti-like
MEGERNKKRIWLKRLLIVGALLFIFGAIAVWFIFTQKFEDTTKQDAAYSVSAMDFIKEFQASDSLANKKYAEKIITVRGRVSETEAADSTINIKMIDTLTDAYIIFAFQQKDLDVAKQLKEGDSVSIKGSCSGGTYSEILETQFINFKRSVLIK